MYNFNEDTLFANKYIHKRRSYTCVTVSNKRPLHCLRIRPTSSLCSAHIAVTAVSNMRHSLFTRRGQIDKVRPLQTVFFSKLSICFFITINRKPCAKSRLVTLRMIVHYRKWSKRAKPEVVFLGLTFRARLRSTTTAPFERAWASFAVKVLSDCSYLVPFPRYRRRNFDYVMPKKSSYENVQIAKKLFYMGKVNPYHVSEHELRKYVNEFRGPR